MEKIRSIKNAIFEVLKYALFLALFCVLQIAKVGEIKPFAFGMMLTLSFLNQNYFVLAPLYIASGLIADWSVATLISCTFTVAVCGVFVFLHKRFKRNLNAILFALYGFLSEVAFLYLQSSNPENFILAIAAVLVGIIAMFCYKTFFKTLIYKGICGKFTADEWVSAGVLIFAIGAGVANLPYLYGVPLVAISVFFVLCASNIIKPSSLFAIFSVYGFGVCFSNGNVEFLALVVSWCLACLLMRGSMKIYQPMALFLCDVLVNIYFFNVYTIYNLMGILLAGFAFLCIPINVFKRASASLFAVESQSTIKDILKKDLDKLKDRILQIGNVFLQLQTTFQMMIKQNITKQQATEVLSKQLIHGICEKCERKQTCLAIKSEQIEKHMQKIIGTALERGKVLVIDTPSKFVAECGKINAILPYANNLCNNFRQQQKYKTNLDNTRLLLGEQLFGVSEILKELAGDMKFEIDNNIYTKNRVIEALLYQNIICIDAATYFKGTDEINVVLLVKSDDIKKEKIAAALTELFKTKMRVYDVLDANKQGFSVVFCGPKINFDIVFGCAGAKKTGSDKSGDTYSILRIDDTQFLMSLCDGMGSGKDAENISALAICLVENFYKAGFSNELIVSSVNKFLSLNGEETFSALDICVFNLKNGVCNLVKLGSPNSFIKSVDTTTEVNGESLPIGILEQISPQISSHVLKNGDMVIFVTDGIADCFANSHELCTFLNNINTKNPQVLADAVLEQALLINNGIANDDMTVLVGRIWNKI